MWVVSAGTKAKIGDKHTHTPLVRVEANEPWPDTGMTVLRWGQLAGTEPIAASPIEFPWAQQRPDSVRDTGFHPHARSK